MRRLYGTCNHQNSICCALGRALSTRMRRLVRGFVSTVAARSATCKDNFRKVSYDTELCGQRRVPCCERRFCVEFGMASKGMLSKFQALWLL
eukprot:6205148-Pleurochrysis_carterae.AAC.2